MLASLNNRRSTRYGLHGLGACSPMGVSYSNTPNGACLDGNTGNIVDCKSSTCSAAGSSPSSSPSAAPINRDPIVIQNIPIGGFTGDFPVPTLDSYLADRLTAKESPFISNAIARGADSAQAEAQDFAAQASDHCGTYPNSSGCENPGPIVQKYTNLFLAWAGSQPANIYQSGDSGTLSNPVNVLTGSAPVYKPPPNTNSTNVLSPPPSKNLDSGNLNNGKDTLNTKNPNSNTGSGTDDISAWIKDNWPLLALGAGGLILLMNMGKGR